MKIMKKIVKFIIEFINRLIKDNVTLYAAQASFFILISSIPFLMLLVSIVKGFIPVTRIEVMTLLTDIFPSNTHVFMSRLVNELFSEVSVSIISVTAITLIWSASRGILSLLYGLHSILGISSKSIVRERIRAILFTFLFILALVIPIFIFFAGSYLGITHTWIKIPLFIILLALTFTAIYTFLPRRRINFFSQFIGGVLASASWVVFSWLYAIYIDNFSSFSYIYGSLAAIILLMLWLYFCLLFFLCGAEFNCLINEKLHKSKNEVK